MLCELVYVSVYLLFFGVTIPENVGALEDLDRRRAVPVLFVKGNHYDIGYDVGRTFGSLIRNFVASYDRLRQFEDEYKTQNGRQAYERTLGNMKKRYPYYVNEIQGVADGSKVPFYQLFLLQMDDIIETVNDNHVNRNDTGGCSSIGLNVQNRAVLGHTEDAFSETLSNFYILSAHVVPSADDKARGAIEERFASLCYAGQLPGYTMGYTGHGLVFSINTLSPRTLKPGHTPRTFLTRALLAAQNEARVEKILRDEGLGAANGFSLNMIWTDKGGSRQLYNVEVAPDLRADRSILNVEEFGNDGDTLVHCNRYERVKVGEVKGAIIDSSAARLAALRAHPTPRSKEDVADLLSDTSGTEYKVFQDKAEAVVKTIAAGIFDLEEMTWSLYIDKPNASEPIAVLPINFPMLH